MNLFISLEDVGELEIGNIFYNWSFVRMESMCRHKIMIPFAILTNWYPNVPSLQSFKEFIV